MKILIKTLTQKLFDFDQPSNKIQLFLLNVLILHKISNNISNFKPSGRNLSLSYSIKVSVKEGNYELFTKSCTEANV